MLRDVATAARQWQVAGARHARDAFAGACRTLADAVDEQTVEEERTLLPMLGEHLQAADWTAIAASSHCRLSAREQLLVLGLALEDSTAADRARLLEGLPRSARMAWRHERRPLLPVRRRPAAGRAARDLNAPRRGSVAGRPAVLAALAIGRGLGVAVVADPRCVRSLVMVLMSFSPSSSVHRER